MTRQSYFCAQLSLRRKMGFKRKALAPGLQPNALRLGITDPFITRPLQCSPLNTADRGAHKTKGTSEGVFYIGDTYFSACLCVSVLSAATCSQPLPKCHFFQFLLQSIILSRPYFPSHFIFCVATQEIKIIEGGIFMQVFCFKAAPSLEFQLPPPPISI